jgi:hypothetical protein
MGEIPANSGVFRRFPAEFWGKIGIFCKENIGIFCKENIGIYWNFAGKGGKMRKLCSNS